MTPETSIDIVALLEESRAGFEAAIEAVAPERAGMKPEPEAWSVLEIIEHVTISERALLGQLMRSEVAESGRRNPARESQVDTAIRNRAAKVEAPERARPAGRFETLDIAKRQYAAARAQTIQFACDRAAELPRLSGQHMRFGPVNGVEMLVIIASHSHRHAAQIRERV